MTEKKRHISAGKKSVTRKSKFVTGNLSTKTKVSKAGKIQNKEVYDITLIEIDSLMKKGEAQLSQFEVRRLSSLAAAAEEFEDLHSPLPIPSLLPDMIRMKMLQLKLKQYFTAKLLGVSEAKFSLIMNGKQKPDIYFIKALHDKLKMDGNEILKAV